MEIITHRGTRIANANAVEITAGRTSIMIISGHDLPLDGCAPSAQVDCFKYDGLTKGKCNYDAIFVTHIHADHRGIIEQINTDIPIYMSKNAKDMLDIAADFSDTPLPRVDNYLEHGRRVKIGDITVVPLETGSRYMRNVLLLFEADGEKILYMSDLGYIDPAYYSLIDSVYMLICESTFIGSNDGSDLNDVQNAAMRIMRQNDKPVFALCSPTDIERLRCLEGACREGGRNMAIDPFQKAIIERFPRLLLVNPCGFIPHPEITDSPRAKRHIISSDDVDFNDIQQFSSTETIAKMNGLAFIMRPSMGDFIKKLSELTPLDGSTLIYTMWQGYKSTKPVKKFLDLCRSLGMNIEYMPSGDYTYRTQLRAACKRLNPKHLASVQEENDEQFLDMYCELFPVGEGDINEDYIP